jgi:hypothetical protein
MGLDQYAYVAAKAGQRDEYYEHYDNKDNPVSEPREIAYWRKHPNLHGWMQKLWEAKGGTGEFNGDELELTWEDIDMLEMDIKNGYVARLGTTGFFFGDGSDDYYKEHDLDFIKKARAELFCGLRVFYNSSW